MSSFAISPNPPVCRTFVASIVCLGIVAAGELAAIGWQAFQPAPAARTEAAPLPAPAAAVTPEPPKPQPEAAPDESPAAEAEKALVASLPTPTPAARREITLESRVNELVAFAKGLRDRGDTATAMTRLREAQSLTPKHCMVISEMALTYEKMGLVDKALSQWRRIYEMGESAGIYYAAAEAKLKALQFPSASEEETQAPASEPVAGGLTPDDNLDPALALGRVGTVDDTGNTQLLRRLRLRVPIQAKPGKKIEPREVVIQVFFYDQLRDGSIVETNANVASSWARRESSSGEPLPVDWSSADPEVLEVEYAQPDYDPRDPRTRERRNYFGYSVRVYYKGQLNAKFADPVKLLNQFIPPSTLPSSDLPQ